MAKIAYKKIGSGGPLKRSRFTKLSLWEGPDHLLQVERDHYTETYKRFFFADIQSINLRRDGRRSTYNIVFGSIIGLLLFFYIMTTTFELQVLWASFMSVFILLALINSLKGPTCVCHITTAVQNEQIPALRRVRKADKIIARVRAAIATSQGLLSPEDLRARLAPPPAMPPPISPLEPAPEMPPPPVA